LEQNRKQLHLHPYKHGAVAQLVEQKTENLCVGGSIPSHTTKSKKPSDLTLMAFLFYVIITMRYFT
jgi:hypothetical protein